MASNVQNNAGAFEMQTFSNSQVKSARCGPESGTANLTRRHRPQLSPLICEEPANGDGEEGDALGPLRDPRRARENSSKKNTVVRWSTMKQGLMNNVGNFFGVGDDETVMMWRDRVERMHANSRLVGRGYRVRTGDTPDILATPTPGITPGIPATAPAIHITSAHPHIYDPLHRGGVSRQTSRVSITSQRFGRTLMTPQTGRESVLRMAFDGFKTLMTPHRERPPQLHARSLVPSQIVRVQESLTPSVVPTPTLLNTAQLSAPGQQLTVPTPMPSSYFTSSNDSVFQDDLDDVFYEEPLPTSAFAASASDFPSLRRNRDQDLVDNRLRNESQEDRHPLSCAYYQMPAPHEKRPSKAGWQPGRSQPEPMAGDTPASSYPVYATPTTFEGMSRISDVVVDDVWQGKRQIGKGFTGFFTDVQYRQSRIDTNIRQQMAALHDHRPYFTYWVTFVQIVCYIVSVSVYGFSSIGFSVSTIEAEVLKSNLAYEKAHYLEDNNMWIGPRQADLIHLGAKYSPCMRRDENVLRAIESDRRLESDTACCIRNDRSGCLQTSRSNCSTMLATWKKMNFSETNRKSGTVCGLDYRYCKNPPNFNELWPDDITKWPVCRDPISASVDHMTCKIQGRPCCIGIQGECIITTREHCTFLRGYFHQDSTLCAQVSCMSEICGMIPFADPSTPDQFYRLFISLFIHAGLLQLIITIIFQIFIMRDLEKLAGTLRISIIYIASGIAGSLSSAVFLPYHVEAGPTGSQFGLLACLFVEIIQNWYILTSPFVAIFRLTAVLLVLFAVGLLPMIDNYAHLVGFAFGFLLAFALLPYITFNVCDRRGKLIGIIVCLLGAAGFFVGLFALFYIAPLYNCPHCHYFNCLPIMPDFCRSMEVRIGRKPWYS